MPSGETARRKLVFPKTVDADAWSKNMELLAAQLDNDAETKQGTYAELPAAGTRGRLYYATDIDVLYWDTGTVWAGIQPLVSNGKVYNEFWNELNQNTNVSLTGTRSQWVSIKFWHVTERAFDGKRFNTEHDINFIQKPGDTWYWHISEPFSRNVIYNGSQIGAIYKHVAEFDIDLNGGAKYRTILL